MANPEKIEIKVLLYEQEIEEYRRQIADINDQKQQWLGYQRAFTEVDELFRVLFRDLKTALDWMTLTPEEKEQAQQSGKGLPKIEVTNDEGFKVGEFLKPAHQLVALRMQKAVVEPDRFDAQRVVLERQIERLKRLIEYERTKPAPEVLEDPWDSVNVEKEVAEPESKKGKKGK